MSATAEILRITDAKEALKTSLAAKGATVPADVKIDGLPAILDALAIGSEKITVTYKDKTTASVPVSTFILGMDWSGIEDVTYSTASVSKLMLGSTVVWTNIESVTVTVYGAASETVTITNGTETFTVATTALGVGTKTIDLPLGTYTVSGSVSGYSHSVEVNMDTTEIAAYPSGAIYWYGREVVAMSTTINAAYSSGNATERANYIELYGWTRPDSVKTSIAQIISANTVNTSGYSSIKFDVTPVSRERANGGYAQFDFGYKSATTNTVAFTGTTLTASGSRKTYSIATPGGSVYIGARAYTAWNGYTGNKRMQAYVHAIWME